MRKWIVVFLSLACLFFYLKNYDISSVDGHPENHGVITKISDGDTFLIEVNGKTEKVRLIGIDTPESKDNLKAKKDAARNSADLDAMVRQGIEARRFVEQNFPLGTTLRIETDRDTRDRYGRMLAYLFTEDGRMINETIIREGYATPLFYSPNYKYKSRLEEAYRYAKSNKKGLWQNGKPLHIRKDE